MSTIADGPEMPAPPLGNDAVPSHGADVIATLNGPVPSIESRMIGFGVENSFTSYGEIVSRTPLFPVESVPATAIVTGPDGGGVATLKEADAEFAGVSLSVAVIVCGPAVVVGTVMEVEKAPAARVTVVNVVASKFMVTEAGINVVVNPLPLTVTTVPTGPEVGVRLMNACADAPRLTQTVIAATTLADNAHVGHRDRISFLPQPGCRKIQTLPVTQPQRIFLRKLNASKYMRVRRMTQLLIEHCKRHYLTQGSETRQLLLG
ncbi:MAG: hypothetical protein O3A46_07420 [Candidatus Poribacteria bacterium]|nr:hypothetical protein [Candidatus Poribacteria bacterium]